MDLEGWRIQAMRAWEAADVFAEEFRLQKQKEFRYRKPDGNGEAVLQSVTNGLTHCKDIAWQIGISKGQVSKLATWLIAQGKLRKYGREYRIR
jgi:hypothetical protein